MTAANRPVGIIARSAATERSPPHALVQVEARLLRFARNDRIHAGGNSMPDVPITVASGDYDRTRALRDGTVPIAGCAVTYSNVEANTLFIRNLKSQEFDVSEMS